MALDDTGNLRVGGVHLDVGLDLSRLRKDLDSVKPILDRFARDNTLDLTVNPSTASGGSSASAGGKSSGGPTSGSRAGAAVLASVSTSAVNRSLDVLAGSLARLGKDLARAFDGVIDAMTQVAKHAKVSARVAGSNEKAGLDLYRAEQANFHLASAGRLFNRSEGIRQTLKPPGAGDYFAALPADVRSWAGGFGPPKLAAKRGRGSGAGAGAGMGPASSVATGAGVGHAGDVLIVAGHQLQKAAADLGRAAFNPTRPAHPLAGVPVQVPGGFLDPGRTRPVGSKIDPVTGERIHPAYYRSAPRKPPDPGFSRAVLPMGGIPSYAPGGGRGSRSGKITLPKDLADAEAAARRLVEPFRRVEAHLAGFGHAGALAFNRTMAGARGFELAIGRAATATRGVRAAAGGIGRLLVSPFTLAARAVGLFDSRVGAGTNALRLIGKAASPLGSTLSAPFKAANKAAGAFSGLLQGLVTGGVMALGSAFGAMAVKGVLASAKMGDSVNAVKSVFKGSAGEMTDFSKELGGRFGTVRKAVLDSSVAIGGALKGTGMGTEKSSAMSKTLITRAADVAAQRQAPGGVAEVAGGMATAISGGSTRAIRQFGIAIDDDMIKAKALAMGLVGVDQEMGRTARAAAVYQLILDKSSDAQGFLANNATSTETVMEALTGRFTNAAAALGAKLEPAFTEILLLLDEFIVGTGKATAAVHDWVGGIVSGVVEGVRFLRKMWQEWDTGVLLVGLVTQQMGENLGDAFTYVGKVAGRVIGWVSDNWRAILTDLMTYVARVMTNLGSIITNAWDQVKKAARGDFADIDVNAFNPIEQINKLLAMDGEKFIAPPLVIDKFKLTNSFGDRITDALAKIMGVDVRLPNLTTEHKKMEDGEEQPGKDKKAKKEKSPSGELLGARQLVDAMQKSVFDKDSKHIAATAENTRGIRPLLQTIGAAVSRGMVARLG